MSSCKSKQTIITMFLWGNIWSWLVWVILSVIYLFHLFMSSLLIGSRVNFMGMSTLKCNCISILKYFHIIKSHLDYCNKRCSQIFVCCQVWVFNGQKTNVLKFTHSKSSWYKIFQLALFWIFSFQLQQQMLYFPIIGAFPSRIITL